MDNSNSLRINRREIFHAPNGHTTPDCRNGCFSDPPSQEDGTLKLTLRRFDLSSKMFSVNGCLMRSKAQATCGAGSNFCRANMYRNNAPSGATIANNEPRGNSGATMELDTDRNTSDRGCHDYARYPYLALKKFRYANLVAMAISSDTLSTRND